jgi:hypothetical protein
MAATLVQDSGQISGTASGSTITVNASSAFIVGNKVIVTVSINLGSGGGTVTSATIAGTTANKDASRETDLFRSCYIFSVDVVNSGSSQVVLDLSTSPSTPTVTGAVIDIQEWSGLGAVDQTANALATSTTNHTITSGTTTQADELVVAVMTTTGNPGATTFPSGYTTIYDNLDGASPTVYGAAVYKTVSAIGTQTATWTLTSATNGRLAIATYIILADVGIPSGIKMKMFANGDVKIANIVEVAGAANKLYANGTYVSSQFIEA